MTDATIRVRVTCKPLDQNEDFTIARKGDLSGPATELLDRACGAAGGEWVIKSDRLTGGREIRRTIKTKHRERAGTFTTTWVFTYS